METLSKVEITLLAVFLGWFLGQGAELLKSYWKRRVLLKAFYNELGDISDHLNESMSKCESGLINLLKTHQSSVSPHPVVRPIYDNYYKDICTFLSPDQRKIINQIHGHVASFNERLSSSGEQKNLDTNFMCMYTDAAWAKESISYLIQYKGSKLLTDDLSKIESINKDFQRVWNGYIRG